MTRHAPDGPPARSDDASGNGPHSAGVTGFAARAGSAVAFWLAVALPVALVALLVAGIDRPTDVATFLLLVGANGTALVAGRGYAATDGDRSS